MSERPHALITYNGLPISSGGAHRIRGKDRVRVWQQMSAFLEVFTTYSRPDDIHLVLFEGRRVEVAFFERAHQLVSDRFGPGERRLASIGAGKEEHEHMWRLSVNDIDAALDVMRRLDPFPADRLGGPLLLVVRATFMLRDPGTGEVLPLQGSELYGGQEADWTLPLGVSVMYLRLGNPSTCALFLSLPFPSVTHRVADYAARIDAALPFRLSEKQWARWQVNAEGTRYYKRRIEVLTRG